YPDTNHTCTTGCKRSLSLRLNAKGFLRGICDGGKSLPYSFIALCMGCDCASITLRFLYSHSSVQPIRFEGRQLSPCCEVMATRHREKIYVNSGSFQLIDFSGAPKLLSESSGRC